MNEAGSESVRDEGLDFAIDLLAEIHGVLERRGRKLVLAPFAGLQNQSGHIELGRHLRASWMLQNHWTPSCNADDIAHPGSSGQPCAAPSRISLATNRLMSFGFPPSLLAEVCRPTLVQPDPPLSPPQ